MSSKQPLLQKLCQDQGWLHKPVLTATWLPREMNDALNSSHKHSWVSETGQEAPL